MVKKWLIYYRGGKVKEGMKPRLKIKKMGIFNRLFKRKEKKVKLTQKNIFDYPPVYYIGSGRLKKDALLICKYGKVYFEPQGIAEIFGNSLKPGDIIPYFDENEKFINNF